ncbi:E3 ubiquitin-protein ligase At4g11680-like [Nicotiana tabacum]|uniref:E3 ubiquitin-protein ligase At1g63170-like n=1 Tax=Nicotiana tabacum TaxID=4097 RepID=A0A1S4CZA7_TOBAC|nr:PREDICTED: E3 ubiquitin-protein ligase At1g63170-like [Nicotiana tabacum]
MNTRYFLTPVSLCHSSIIVSFPPIISAAAGDERMSSVGGTRNRSILPSSLLVRMAMRISRARWFSFLRRVFHYQNGSRSDLGSNPLNSMTWMMMECIALSVQIIIASYTLAVSKEEKPVWPMKIWVLGYAFGCIISVMLLYWRYWAFYVRPQRDDSDMEQQRSHDEYSRALHVMEILRTGVELFFAIWFVMGNVWVFESRFLSYHRAPKLHLLCISLLTWNAVAYSFPFLLFLLLCCCVPILSSFLGYNMNMGSVDRGASDEQLSSLPSWKYKESGKKEQPKYSGVENENENVECCICLAKYGDKEEIRQLPCSHIFHLKCVDQWLRIISCCPLCKQELER